MNALRYLPTIEAKTRQDLQVSTFTYELQSQHFFFPSYFETPLDWSNRGWNVVCRYLEYLAYY